MKKLILFELNEVPLRIIDYFVHARPKSALARIYPRARKYETFTEDIGHLSPWITWPTFHRGVPNSKHFVQEFGQPLADLDREFPPIWKILADHRISVGVFGSLHSYPPPRSYENYSFYVPDVFASGAECFPKSLEAFQEFNLRMSRESGRNVSGSVPFAETVALISNLSELGFKPRTFADIARQLVEERVDRWKVVRRRTYQAVLGFDVFYRQLASKRPAFTTFFTNHVASSLHRYWAAAFPEDYAEIGFEPEWLNTFNQEILFTMSKADEMIGRLVEFVDGDESYELMIATSMGQEATVAQPVETQLYVTDGTTFMSRLGVPRDSWDPRPAMVPQFNAQVSTALAGQLENHLSSLLVNGDRISFVHKPTGFFSVMLGQQNLASVSITLGGAPVSLSELGWANVEIQDKSGSTAYHIPQGSLLRYHRGMAPSGHVSKISTLDVFPHILANFGIKAPAYASAPATL